MLLGPDLCGQFRDALVVDGTDDDGPHDRLAVDRGLDLGVGVDEDQLDDSDTTLALTGGYRWGWLGVEVGYADFGAYEEDFRGFLEDDTPITVISIAELQGWTAGLNVRAPLSDKWSLTGRAGVFAWDTNAFTDVPTFDRIDLDDDGTDWYAGIGVAYSVTEKFDLGLAYDHYRASGDYFDLAPDVFSATAEFRLRGRASRLSDGVAEPPHPLLACLIRSHCHGFKLCT